MVRPRPYESSWRVLLLGGCVVLAGGLLSAEERAEEDSAAPAALSREDRDFFEREIRPVLVERCYDCHSARSEKLKAGLHLDSREALLRGGETGPVLIPGKPEASRLIEALRYENVDLQMPPREKLPAATIAAFEEWVRRGAPDPRSRAPAVPFRRDSGGLDIEARKRSHWAWRALDAGAPLPLARGRATGPDWARTWPREELDDYILAWLEAAGLKPAPAASSTTWYRRLSFDLTGLPPTRSELGAFLADERPGARERAVDRLLASSAFGERWGVHWLDLVRFAETRGHEQDYDIPEAWRYRDYIVRALDQDVPYDQLVTEHIAGDLLPGKKRRYDPVDGRLESIQGTGFWHLHEATHSPVDITGDEAERNANQIDVFSRAFLGLSLGCARCHDHKFDAISQKDFYALYGYLQSSSYQLADVAAPQAQASAARELRELRARLRPKIAELAVGDLRDRAGRLEAYLRFGAELLRQGEELPESFVAGASQEHGLDPQVLAAWREHLGRAAADEFALFAPLARVARDGPAELALALESWSAREESESQAVAARQITSTVEEGERNYVTRTRARSPEDRVVDYARGDRKDWIPSGLRFGRRARGPGELVLGESAERAVESAVEEGYATSRLPSPRFSGFLRTPTFEVRGNTLWYRYRGQAEVFVAVDSHRVVAGPLHGVVKQRLGGKKSPVGSADQDRGWRWRAHNLRDYIGHRVHVEFRPTSPDFELSRLEFSDSEPRAPYRAPPLAPRLGELLATKQTSVAALATAYATAFREALALDDKGRLEGKPEEAARKAWFFNWLLAHPELLPPQRAKTSSELAGHFDELAREVKRIEASIPGPTRALALLDGDPEEEPVHIRGNHRTKSAEAVPRRFLTALGGEAKRKLSPFELEIAAFRRQGSGRLDLARRVFDPTNPLSRRVIVNRVWHHLFGRGLVASVDDFGVMGEKPSHPRLLDALAIRFEREGWSLKRLIRTIVLSATYGMSSRAHPETAARALELDPENLLLHRAPIRRLSAEAIRDSLLAVSGRLDRRRGGPSVEVHITPFMRGNRSPGGSGPADGDGRRSLYIKVRRNHLSHFLTTFDRPTPFATIGRRSRSNSPAQPLILLNDPLVHDQALLTAERIEELERERGTEAALSVLYESLYARQPRAGGRALAREFLGPPNDATASPRVEVWRDLIHALFNVKEFIYLN